MKEQDPKRNGDASGSPFDKNAKGSPESPSLTDPREPWRIAVAAAEANADAQLRWANEVAALRKELKVAVVPDDTMRALRDRVSDLEQTLRNQAAQPPTVPVVEPSIPPVIAWLLFIMLLWLASVTGVLAGHVRSETESARQGAATTNGGFRP